MPSQEIIALEKRIKDLERKVEDQSKALSGRGTIVNSGNRFGIDRSINISEILNRINDVLNDTAVADIDYSKLSNHPWTEDKVNGYLFPATITNRVGIKTQAPDSDLQVNGNVHVNGNINVGGTGYFATNLGVGVEDPVVDFQVNGTSSFGDSVTLARSARALNHISTDAVQLIWRFTDDTDLAPASELVWGNNDPINHVDNRRWDFYVRSNDTFNIRRRTAGIDEDYITINSDGYVGIGVGTLGGGFIAPSTLLELIRDDAHPILTITAAHNSSYNPQIRFRAGSTPSTKWTIANDSGNSHVLKFLSEGDVDSGNSVWNIKNTGYTGINNTDPKLNLHIKGAPWAYSAATGIIIQSVDGGASDDTAPGLIMVDKGWVAGNPSQCVVGMATENQAWALEAVNGDMIFRSKDGGIGFAIWEGGISNARMKMFMDNDGNFGINENNPQDKLEVNGTILVKDKLKFTQDDGNEYIDSEDDGNLDIVATSNIDINGNSRIGDGGASNFTQISNSGDMTFNGSAGFYPRVLSQDAEPAAGTGNTQIDSGETIIWVDTDDSNRRYIMFNHGGTIVKTELT